MYIQNSQHSLTSSCMSHLNYCFSYAVVFEATNLVSSVRWKYRDTFFTFVTS